MTMGTFLLVLGRVTSRVITGARTFNCDCIICVRDFVVVVVVVVAAVAAAFAA